MKLYSFVPAAVALAAVLTGGLLRTSTSVVSGSLIRGSLPAVYYVGPDELRYVFPNDKAYFTWYQDFNGVTQVSDSELASFRIGGNVTYRPGTRLVKIQSDPKVYAVDANGTLRWVKTEAAAVALFGANWSKQVDDISDSFFVNYKVGADISAVTDFNPASAKSAAANISDDKKISYIPATNVNANVNSNANIPVEPPALSCANSCDLGSACVANQCRAVPGPSNVGVKIIVLDTADVCFVGDACTGGACCTIGGNQFADNANLMAVKPRDKYLYADKQQLCGRSTVSSADFNRINSDLNAWNEATAINTGNKLNLVVSTTHLSGETTLSRVKGTCNWHYAPADMPAKAVNAVDSSTDAVIAIGSRDFDFGALPVADQATIDQASGVNGAGYSYIVKEWDINTDGPPAYTAFNDALRSQLNSAVALGVSDPTKPYVGNHCRDGKKDLDETGLDCGGNQCAPCI